MVVPFLLSNHIKKSTVIWKYYSYTPILQNCTVLLPIKLIVRAFIAFNATNINSFYWQAFIPSRKFLIMFVSIKDLKSKHRLWCFLLFKHFMTSCVYIKIPLIYIKLFSPIIIIAVLKEISPWNCRTILLLLPPSLQIYIASIAPTLTASRNLHIRYILEQLRSKRAINLLYGAFPRPPPPPPPPPPHDKYCTSKSFPIVPLIAYCTFWCLICTFDCLFGTNLYSIYNPHLIPS